MGGRSCTSSAKASRCAARIRTSSTARRYVPLYADAGREDNVVAFALRRNGNAVIAVAPRLFARLLRADDAAPLGAPVWGEAAISLPEDLRGEFVDAMTGERHRPEGKLQVAALLARFPVALLVRT